jgi:hypothetical protein
MLRFLSASLLAWGLGVGLGPADVAAQRFLPDDPVWEDPDRLDMPVPEPRTASERVSPVEVLSHTFGSPGVHSGPATNVNTLGEVPNSSWYTNRHYWHEQSPEALARGPNAGPPPDTAAPWRVTSVTTRRGLPNAVITDRQQRRYRLTFDSPAHPELATGAAMIASRLFHALGYYVPEHHLLRIAPDQLRAEPYSGVVRADVWTLFNTSHPYPDGTYRVLATRIPDAYRRIGPWRFHGTRHDDGNDVFPHELRRELRGLRVFCAWMNHSKINESNTLGVVVRDGDRHYVRHYLRRFEATLGSAGAAPKAPWSGHEHVLDLGSVFTRIGTLGIAGGSWRNAKTPDLRGVGHIEAAFFRPPRWRAELPNPAFERADPADAFWAARQVAAFSRADVKAVVATAQFTQPEAETYLVETLLARRDSIAHAYLDFAGGLDRFRVQGADLRFVDLRARHGLAPDSVQRTVVWRAFDNQRNQATDRLARVRTAAEALSIPPAGAAFLQAAIRTPGRGTTTAYLRRDGVHGSGAPRYELVGLNRSAGP